MTAITREFDGKERSFEIKREHIPYFESAVGSLYLKLQKMTGGELLFSDVAAVISFALHGPSQTELVLIGSAKQAAKHGLPSAFGIGSYVPNSDVVAVLEREGHGNFAPLAADILSATLFGELANGD